MNRQRFLLMMFGLAVMSGLVTLSALDEPTVPGFSLIEQTRVGLVAQNDASFGAEVGVAVEEVEDSVDAEEEAVVEESEPSSGEENSAEADESVDEATDVESEEEIEEPATDLKSNSELLLPKKQLVEATIPKSSWYTNLLTTFKRFRA